MDNRNEPHPLIRRIFVIVATAAALLTLASCSGEDDSSSDESTSATNSTSPSQSQPTQEPQQSGEPQTVADSLDAPWSIAFHDGTPLVSERDNARILELDDQGTPREVATIEGATPLGEAGLLGIAVRDGSLYTYFTASGENRIERRKITGEPGSLGLGPPKTIIDGIPSASIHNGGRIAFGPDDMLYATAGDAGDESNSQNRDSLGGKILRLTPDGKVPADNPFEGSPVYSYGHRNPQGIAWSGGKMYASEFGQDTWDELNVIEPGGNYGWPEVEGKASQDGFIDPVQQWTPDEASPSGIATSGGNIYIANLRGERLRIVPIDDLSSSTETITGNGRLRDVVNAPDGSLWVLTNNTDGRGVPGPDDDQIIRLQPD